MKKLLLALFASFAICFGGAGLGLATVSAADPVDGAKKEVCLGISGQVGGDCQGGAKGINKLMTVALQFISFIAGFAAVVMIIVAGIKYVLSSGDSTNIASAKTTLIYALVGLVVVALAQFLVIFVLSKANT